MGGMTAAEAPKQTNKKNKSSTSLLNEDNMRPIPAFTNMGLDTDSRANLQTKPAIEQRELPTAPSSTKQSSHQTTSYLSPSSQTPQASKHREARESVAAKRVTPIKSTTPKPHVVGPRVNKFGILKPAKLSLSTKPKIPKLTLGKALPLMPMPKKTQATAEPTPLNPFVAEIIKLLGGKKASSTPLTEEHGKKLINIRHSLPMFTDEAEKKDRFHIEEKLFEILNPPQGRASQYQIPTLGDFYKSIGAMPDTDQSQGNNANDEIQGGAGDGFISGVTEVNETVENIVDVEESEKEKEPLTFSYMKEGEMTQVEIPDQPANTIDGNQQNYRRMDEILNNKKDAIKSHWFKAAYEVTSLNGIGAAENINAGFLTDEDEGYLKYVHHELAEINYANFHKLSNGEEIKGLEGLRGKELDYALVELEQENVERLTNEYFKSNPNANKAEIIESLNDSSHSFDWTNDLPQGFKDIVPVEGATMNLYFFNARENSFKHKEYDVGNLEHRIKLGKAMVDIIYRERGEE